MQGRCGQCGAKRAVVTSSHRELPRLRNALGHEGSSTHAVGEREGRSSAKKNVTGTHHDRTRSCESPPLTLAVDRSYRRTLLKRNRKNTTKPQRGAKAHTTADDAPTCPPRWVCTDAKTKQAYDTTSLTRTSPGRSSYGKSELARCTDAAPNCGDGLSASVADAGTATGVVEACRG